MEKLAQRDGIKTFSFGFVYCPDCVVKLENGKCPVCDLIPENEPEHCTRKCSFCENTSLGARWYVVGETKTLGRLEYLVCKNCIGNIKNVKCEIQVGRLTGNAYHVVSWVDQFGMPQSKVAHCCENAYEAVCQVLGPEQAESFQEENQMKENDFYTIIDAKTGENVILSVTHDTPSDNMVGFVQFKIRDQTVSVGFQQLAEMSAMFLGMIPPQAVDWDSCYEVLSGLEMNGLPTVQKLYSVLKE